jgi:hypothetical protein
VLHFHWYQGWAIIWLIKNKNQHNISQFSNILRPLMIKTCSDPEVLLFWSRFFGGNQSTDRINKCYVKEKDRDRKAWGMRFTICKGVVPVRHFHNILRSSLFLSWFNMFSIIYNKKINNVYKKCCGTTFTFNSFR